MSPEIYVRKYRKFLVKVIHYGDVVYNLSKNLSTDVLVPMMMPVEDLTYFLTAFPSDHHEERRQREIVKEALDIIESHRDVEYCNVVKYQWKKLFFVARKSYGTLKSFIKNNIIALEPMYVVDGIKYFPVLARNLKDLMESEKMIRKVSPVPVRVSIIQGEGGRAKKEATLKTPLDALSILTPMERKALTYAYRMGYFEWPKRAHSDEISEKLGITKATFSEHLRKAEKKVLQFFFEIT